MDILFVCIAVCPAVMMAKKDLGQEAVTWKSFLPKFSEWFLGVTFFNLLLLYVQDWGNFDFSVLTVQFLLRYMINSIAIILLMQCFRFFRGHVIKKADKQEENSYDL